MMTCTAVGDGYPLPAPAPGPPGGELWGRIKRGRYGEAEAAAIIREILRAVAQCHAKGVVLRDVSSSSSAISRASPDAIRPPIRVSVRFRGHGLI